MAFPSLHLTFIDIMRLWPTTPESPQLTPRQQEKNPFDAIHPLLSAHPVKNDLTPLPSPTLASRQPTTHVSLHAPVFNIMQPPPPKSSALTQLTPAPSPQSAVSKGQIHLKLIQSRGLSVRNLSARPYCVVQFEQNEFVSRDPIPESDKEVKGKPVARIISRQSSSTAVNALDAIGSRHGSRKNSDHNSNSHPPPPPPSSGIPSGLFTRLSPNNPIWKHEVSFDVTSEAEEELITINVYDRAASDQGFLGTVQIKPVLIHDHTVDQWYKLRPFDHEVVTGEIRIQVTYEQYKTKRALTPRDFEFLKLIGRGTFGKVFQVRKKDTKRIYAMKVLSKKEIVAKKEVAHTIGERKILQRSLDCPFLVGLKFSFQTDTDLYLVTDFKSGGELFWHLQKETRFSEERARFYIAELILALEHLHKFNIVYRDLKPENILLDATGHVALCDFGLSKADLRPDELTTTFCGTTEYLAPEILLDEQGYSKIVDFWSLGVLLFEMCCGWSPFYAEDTQAMYKNICFGKIRFPKGVIGDEGKQFVKGLLNRNPKNRLGAQRDAAELKEHPFFASIDWHALSLKKVTPPFKPVVESDESTNNFDPEFTSADIREVGGAEMMMMLDEEEEMAGAAAHGRVGGNGVDEDDPSERWVSQSFAASQMHAHQPNGPLGSERKVGNANANGGGGGPLSSITNGGYSGHLNGHGHTNGYGNGYGNGSSASSSRSHTQTNPTPTQGITIKKPKRPKDGSGVGSPLTNSVQEKFRGFTYHGGESLVAHMGVGRRDPTKGKTGAENDDDGENGEESSGTEGREVTTEDEFEDSGRSAGRYANARRKGLVSEDGDDVMS